MWYADTYKWGVVKASPVYSRGKLIGCYLLIPVEANRAINPKANRKAGEMLAVGIPAPKLSRVIRRLFRRENQ